MKCQLYTDEQICESQQVTYAEALRYIAAQGYFDTEIGAYEKSILEAVAPRKPIVEIDDPGYLEITLHYLPLPNARNENDYRVATTAYHCLQARQLIHSFKHVVLADGAIEEMAVIPDHDNVIKIGSMLQWLTSNAH